jgi:hypothetical protein
VARPGVDWKQQRGAQEAGFSRGGAVLRARE